MKQLNFNDDYYFYVTIFAGSVETVTRSITNTFSKAQG